MPHREILETIDINDIFKNPDSANIRLFRNGEKIIKSKQITRQNIIAQSTMKSMTKMAIS